MRDIANLLKTKTVIAAMCDVFNVYDAKRCIVAAGGISAGQDPASLFEQDEAAGRDSLATVAKIKQLAIGPRLFQIERCPGLPRFNDHQRTIGQAAWPPAGWFHF